MEGSTTSSTTEVAKQQASEVGESARDQAARVGDEARYQTRQLADEARARAREQADEQLGRTASALGRLSDELRSMADVSTREDGYLGSFVHDGATVVGDLAHRLESGGMDAAMEDVRRFARRRPGTFIVGAALLGVGLGRMTRNVDTRRVADAARGDGAGQDSPGQGSATSIDLRDSESMPEQRDESLDPAAGRSSVEATSGYPGGAR